MEDRNDARIQKATHALGLEARRERSGVWAISHGGAEDALSLTLVSHGSWISLLTTGLVQVEEKDISLAAREILRLHRTHAIARCFLHSGSLDVVVDIERSRFGAEPLEEAIRSLALLAASLRTKLPEVLVTERATQEEEALDVLLDWEGRGEAA